MLGSYERSMVDRHAGATPVEQPEPSEGERLVASVVESDERHRSRLRPVNVADIECMAYRIGHAAQDMVLTTLNPGQGSPEFRRSLRAYMRRVVALRRLATAMQRQAGGEQR